MSFYISSYWGAPCIGGDWLLAVARIFPFLLIFFMDTSLFYQVGTGGEGKGREERPGFYRC